MEYVKTVLKEELRIEDVISIHHFEYTKDFAFSGEVHDFWELVYADKGELYVTAGNEEFLLFQGEMYLHKPMEFHNIRCNGQQASDSVIVAFSSGCERLFEIAGRKLICSDTDRSLLAAIIAEAKNAFSTPLGDPFTVQLLRREEQVFGGEQIIHILLEMLMIHLVRTHAERGAVQAEGLAYHDKKLAEICRYLEENVEKGLTFQQICGHFSVNGTRMKKLFRTKVGCGLMEYYNQCKVFLKSYLLSRTTNPVSYQRRN